jgi:tetratricopeptide (TPR) repeat protein
MALLRKEIAGIHELFRMTPASSADRPELLQRLGDRYVELELAADRDRADFQRRADLFDEHRQSARAAELRQQAADANELSKWARREAISAYTRRLAEAPTWCEPARSSQQPARCGDDVSYRLAGIYVRAGDTERARRTFFELGRRWPRSSFASRAALGDAELRFDAARADPSRWPAAERAFRRLVARLPPGNTTWAYATYKLGHVYWHQGEFGAALDQLSGAMKAVSRTARPATPLPFEQAIRDDLVSVFAVHGSPSDAYELLSAVAADREVAMGMLEQLGQTYLDVGLYHRAEQIYSDLVGYNGGASACGYQAKAAYARIASAPFDRVAITAKLRDLLRTQRTFRALGVEPALQEHCRTVTVSLLSQTAFRWHAAARRAAPDDSRRDSDLLTSAARLYRLLLDNYADAELRSVVWTGGSGARPLSHGALRLALADVAMAQGKWRSCGRAYDRVVGADGTTTVQQEDAVLGAAECYLEAYRAAGAQDVPSSLPPPSDGLTRTEQVMLAAFDRYACRVVPPPGQQPDLERHARILVARGELHAKAGRLRHAADAFRNASLQQGSTPAGAAAGAMYLAAVAQLGGDLARPQPACFDEAARDLGQLQQRYCTGAALLRYAGHCARFARVEYDLVRNKAGALLAQCQSDPDGAESSCLAAAELYDRVWRRQGEPACQADSPACHETASLLYLGARAYEAGGQLDRAIALREMLTGPRYHLSGTAVAERALAELAASYETRGKRVDAVRAYERLVRRRPRGELAPDALAHAARLRMELGHLDRAVEHARQFHLHNRQRAPRRSAAVVVAVAERLARLGRWADARRLVTLAAGSIRSAATLDVRVLAHATLGRASVGLRDYRSATRAYEAVSALWSDEPSCLRELERLGGTAVARERRHARVMAAVAESLLFVGETARRRAELERFPQYRGPATRRAVERHVSQTVLSWVSKRRQAMAPAEAAYARVIALDGGSPPPAYSLAARLGLGRMWADLVLAIRGAPHPRRWNRSGYVPGSQPPLLWAEIRAAYRERLWAESLPYEARATAVNADCVTLGSRQGRLDAVRICRERLTELSPNGPGPIERLAAIGTTVDVPRGASLPLED